MLAIVNNSLVINFCISVGALNVTRFDVLPPLNITSLTCREGFFEQNFTCLPSCMQWDNRPQASSLKGVQGFFVVLTWFFSVLFLSVFAVRRKVL